MEADVRIWRKLGMTEDRVLQMQHMCYKERNPINLTDCHVKEGWVRALSTND